MVSRRNTNYRNGSRSWIYNSCTTCLTYWPTTTNIERYQISHGVEGFILKLILRSLVNCFRLEDNFVDNEMKSLSLAANSENVVAGLGCTVSN